MTMEITKHRIRIGLYASTAASKSAKGRRFKQVKHSNRDKNHRNCSAIPHLLLTVIGIIIYNDLASSDPFSSFSYFLKPESKNLKLDDARPFNATIYSSEENFDRLRLMENNKTQNRDIFILKSFFDDWHGSCFYSISTYARRCDKINRNVSMCLQCFTCIMNEETSPSNANEYQISQLFFVFLGNDEFPKFQKVPDLNAFITLFYKSKVHGVVTTKSARVRQFHFSVFLQTVESFCPTEVLVLQYMQTWTPVSGTLYRTTIKGILPLHTEGIHNIELENVTTFSTNEYNTMSRFIIDDQIRTGKMNNNGTCSFLIGNKGTHCYNGNPGRGSEDEVQMQPELLNLIKEDTESSVGYIRFKITDSEGNEQIRSGTGFRVGTEYLMTAYHVLREIIDKMLGKIALHLTHSTNQEITIDHIANILEAQLEDRNNEQSTERISNILKFYVKKTGMRMQVLMNKLEDTFDMSAVQSDLTQWWYENCVVDFINHGRFMIDWNIVFGNERCDIVIVKLNETFDGQDFPNALLLDDKFIPTNNHLIFRYIIRENGPFIDADQSCGVYTDDAALQRDVNEAVDWWNQHYPEYQHSRFFDEAYNDCRTAHNEDVGRVIIRSSKSFTEGSSGSPIVYLFNIDGQPAVSMIYQGGYPRFYYENAWARWYEVPEECFFERGTTMSKLFELLSDHGATYLRRNIFSKPKYSTSDSRLDNIEYRLDLQQENQESQHEKTAQRMMDIQKDQDLFQEVVRDEFVKTNRCIEVIYSRQESMIKAISTLKDAKEATQQVQDSSEEKRPDIMMKTIDAWRQETICTKIISAARTKLLSEHCVCVIGKPNAGKSIIIQQCALWLEKEFEFSVYSIDSLTELEKYFKNETKQVFVVDNALGVLSLSDEKIDNWTRENEKILAVLGENTKLLISISSHLFNHPRIKCKNFVFCDKSKIINISDDQYKLIVDEMKEMLTHHLNVQGVQNPNDYISKIWTTPDSTLCTDFSDWFPFLCKVFSGTDSLKQNPYQFFADPFPALKTTFENIKVENEALFCGLVLCTLYDGKLTSDLLRAYYDSPNHRSDDTVLRDWVINRCGLKCPDHLKLIEDALNSIDGIYISYTDKKYQISDEIVRDIVIYLFEDPWLVFTFGSSEFIRDRVRINAPQENDYFALVYTDMINIQRLAERLLLDLKYDEESGAKLIVENPNIEDSRLMTCLVSALQAVPKKGGMCRWLSLFKSIDKNHIVIDMNAIDELFRQCMLTLYFERQKYKSETLHSLIIVCLKRGADCNMYIGDRLYPLDVAVITGDSVLKTLLLQYGADKSVNSQF